MRECWPSLLPRLPTEPRLLFKQIAAPSETEEEGNESPITSFQVFIGFTRCNNSERAGKFSPKRAPIGN